MNKQKQINIGVTITYFLGLFTGFIMESWWGIPVYSLILFLFLMFLDKLINKEFRKTKLRSPK